MQSDEQKRKRASDIYDQGRDAVVHKIVELETKVEMIGEHLKKLEARVNQDSHNSNFTRSGNNTRRNNDQCDS